MNSKPSPFSSLMASFDTEPVRNQQVVAFDFSKSAYFAVIDMATTCFALLCATLTHTQSPCPLCEQIFEASEMAEKSSGFTDYNPDHKLR